jgi:GGDEF domain-containing protein
VTDVDRLHVVNENYGVHVGNEVIVTTAETICANLGANVSAVVRQLSPRPNRWSADSAAD